MKFEIKYKPVLQPLPLSGYHPDYGTESLQVCVNPPKAFMEEREALLKEQAERSDAASEQMKDPAAEVKQQAVDSLNEWAETVYLPQMNAWFARLWSFGDDKWSADDLGKIHETDAHLLTWLKVRSIEMVDAHRLARKKN